MAKQPWKFEEIIERLQSFEDFLEAPSLFKKKFGKGNYQNVNAVIFGLREIQKEERWPKFLPIVLKEWLPFCKFIFPKKVTHLYYPYYFVVSKSYHNSVETFWTDGRKEAWTFQMTRISFDEVFDHLPSHIQERMVFDLDLFR